MESPLSSRNSSLQIVFGVFERTAGSHGRGLCDYRYIGAQFLRKRRTCPIFLMHNVRLVTCQQYKVLKAEAAQV